VIVDLFAGAGGWDCGIRDVLGHDGLVVGLEWDRWACATRAAAGLPTIRCDIDTYPPDQFTGRVDGLIASPPCQDFSVAGNGAGRDGERGRLVDVPLRWVEAVRPRWVACEQVPPVLPIWQEHAHRYRQLGYSAWTGVLNAADHGVPQTRKRAILIARLDGPALPPAPTHARNPEGVDLFGSSLLPWVSMAEALGWDGVLDRRQQQGAPDERVPVRLVDCTEPAPTVTTQAVGQWLVNDRNVTASDAATLQSFPAGWPWKGTTERVGAQVGNAVPPVLAAAILAPMIGGAP